MVAVARAAAGTQSGGDNEILQSNVFKYYVGRKIIGHSVVCTPKKLQSTVN